MIQVDLHLGDCMEILQELGDATVDSCTCDPPYGLFFTGVQWDALNRKVPYKSRVENPKWATQRGGFMPGYSRGGTNANVIRHRLAANRALEEFSQAWLTQTFRILRPNGRVQVFGGTRTFHRVARAMQAVGFTQIQTNGWVHATGMPKSVNVGREIRKIDAANYHWDGYGTALKPCWESVLVGVRP